MGEIEWKSNHFINLIIRVNSGGNMSLLVNPLVLSYDRVLMWWTVGGMLVHDLANSYVQRYNLIDLIVRKGKE
jgi:hypothetical protein